jgi:hypothetical protein
VTLSLKEKLDRAASDSGRSQSQEAELRLEQSFRDQRLIEDSVLEMVYGRQLAGMLLMIGYAARSAIRSATYDEVAVAIGEANWLSDSFAFEQFASVVKTAVDGLRPKGDNGPEGIETRIGKLSAQAILSGVKNPEFSELSPRAKLALDPQYVERSQRIHALIGNEAASNITTERTVWEEATP